MPLFCLLNEYKKTFGACSTKGEILQKKISSPAHFNKLMYGVGEINVRRIVEEPKMYRQVTDWMWQQVQDTSAVPDLFGELQFIRLVQVPVREFL
jgi:hypothetical protein